MKTKSGFGTPRRVLMSTSTRPPTINDEDASLYQKLLGDPEPQSVLEERRKSRGYSAGWIMGLVQYTRRRPIVVIASVLGVVAVIVLIVPLAVVYGSHSKTFTSTGSWANGTWGAKNFKNLVAFGDSYTDESRGLYFQGHGGQAPPTGWIGPIVSLE
jgi:hypothetical protein